MMNKLRLILIVTVLLSGALQAQDIHFSQYFMSPLNLNPGLTAEHDGKIRLISNYKSQWSSVTSNPYKTVAFSADGPVKKGKLGAGINFFNDKAGDSKMGQNQVNLSLSTSVKINQQNSIRVGLQGGWVQRSADIGGVTFGNQLDGKGFNSALPSGEAVVPSYSYIDVGSGIFWNYVKDNQLTIYSGVAGNHLNSPKYTYYANGNDKLAMRFTAHGGAMYHIKHTKTTIVPTYLYLKQGPYSELNVGAAVKYGLGMDSKYTGVNESSSIYFGGYYRMKDALIVYSRYDFKNFLSLGLSYDINLSKLKTASSGKGGLELSLLYILKDKNVTVKTKPSFM